MSGADGQRQPARRLSVDDMRMPAALSLEDDFCNGRRQFDLSHNASSEYLYYEILDACTYRPLCPSAPGGRALNCCTKC